jgi:hypothetical protein
MITLLADSNALRHPGLEEYLGVSLDHAVALSDLTLIEMRKSNALQTSRSSLRFVTRFPRQSFVLRRSDQILDENVRSRADADRLFDYSETVALAALAKKLQMVPEPAGLRQHMAELEAAARVVITRLEAEVAALEPGLIDAAQDFTHAELTQIRTLEGVEDGTRRKLLDLLKLTTAEFIRRNQDPQRREPLSLRDALGTFAFRYSLCMLLYYMEWVRRGRTGRKLQRRLNDVVDMQVAAMGTYFNGVLSADRDLRMISNTARGVLRGFGAYVPEDWTPLPT